jgi:hypothetical protein
MAKKAGHLSFVHSSERVKKVTSIGNSSRSIPKNKHKRRTWKKYVAQGK